jgi:tellurite resistance protein TerC
MVFPLSFWLGFLAFVLFALAIDLGLLNHRDEAISFKKASALTCLWFVLASLFCVFIYNKAGSDSALEFITGYIVELSLSMDNVFVFILIFNYFKVPVKYQHRVLFWGILGAIIMRFIMIMAGVYIFNKFGWLFILFGLFLIYTGYKIAFTEEKDGDVKDQQNGAIKFLQRFMRVSHDFDGHNFTTRVKNKLYFTPLFVVLLLIEKTDLIFALDSIPAILAITQEPFIVFTSNIFAILGLRAMYFMLASVIHKFAYLKYGISIILIFVGCKMLATIADVHVPTVFSLGFIIVSLAGSILYSLKMTASSGK